MCHRWLQRCYGYAVQSIGVELFTLPASPEPTVMDEEQNRPNVYGINGAPVLFNESYQLI